MRYFFLTSTWSIHHDIAQEIQRSLGFTPCLWLGPRTLVDQVAEHYPDCEFFTKEQLLFLESEPPVLSFEQFEKMKQYWESDSFRNQRVNLLEEFNRYPNLALMRSVDREAILRLTQMSIAKVIFEHKPDFLLSLDVPHNPVNLAAYEVAKWLGVPSLFFVGLATFAPGVVPHTSVATRFRAELPKGKPPSPEIRRAEEFVREQVAASFEHLRDGLETHWQAFERHNVGGGGDSSTEAKRKPRKRLRLRNPWRRAKPIPLERQLYLHYRGSLPEAHAQLPDSSPSSQHGLFTLHYQPEATVVPRGLGDTFQGEAIMRAREILPPDIPLVVKEHPSQIGREGRRIASRSPHFYTFTKGLPNTFMVSAQTPSADLLSTSTVVFTLTGTVGVEAAVRGIPVVYFGAPWWAGMPGTFHADSDNLAEQLESYQRPDFTAIQDFVFQLLDDYAIPGFVGVGREQYWEKATSLPEQFNEAFVQRASQVVSQFSKHLDG